MMIKIILLTWFCPVCTLWLLPILLGAWLLGWYYGKDGQRKLLEKYNELKSRFDEIEEKNKGLESINATITTSLDEKDATLHDLSEKYEIMVAKLNACTAKNEQLAMEMKTFSTKKIEEVEVVGTIQKAIRMSNEDVVAEAMPDDDDSENIDMIIGERDISDVPFLKDDLKIIEGVGPKIERILKAAKIDTWAKLSETTVTRLNQILKTAGPRFQMHKPDSWPIQARYAEAGAWDKLVAYQKKLNMGKLKEDTERNTSSKLGRLFKN